MHRFRDILYRNAGGHGGSDNVDNRGWILPEISKVGDVEFRAEIHGNIDDVAEVWTTFGIISLKKMSKYEAPAAHFEHTSKSCQMWGACGAFHTSASRIWAKIYQCWSGKTPVCRCAKIYWKSQICNFWTLSNTRFCLINDKWESFNTNLSYVLQITCQCHSKWKYAFVARYHY